LAYRPRSDVITPGSQIVVTPEESPVIPAMLFAFAPLHKRAFGVATGVAGGLLMAAITVPASCRKRVSSHWICWPVLPGYSVTWPGVVIGAA
jgi:hypothetical protein